MTEAITAARRYRDAPSGQPGRGLCAVPDRLGLLRPDPRRHPRSGAAPSRRSPRSTRCRAISEFRIRANAKRKIEVARDQLAGKEMVIGRYYLHRQRFHRRDQPLQDRGHAVPDHPPRRGGADAADRGLYGARHRQRGADRGRGARPQFPRQPLVQGFLSAGEGRRLRAAENKGSWISHAFAGIKSPFASSSRTRS